MHIVWQETCLQKQEYVLLSYRPYGAYTIIIKFVLPNYRPYGAIRHLKPAEKAINIIAWA